MLAVVAVLFVIVISVVVGTDGGKQDAGSGPGAPLDSLAHSTAHSGPSAKHRQQGRPHRPTSQRASSHRSSPTATVGTTRPGGAKCPTLKTCVIEGDVGNGVQAINDYRTAHGRPAVPGQASPQAQFCALSNGNSCSGGWAETELAQPNGAEAVQKILPFAHLLDPMRSVEVGWAYDPQARLYYFAIIRNS
jgi:hypothetical protein